MLRTDSAWPHCLLLIKDSTCHTENLVIGCLRRDAACRPLPCRDILARRSARRGRSGRRRLLAPCNDVSRRHRWSRRQQPDPPERQLLRPPSGVQASYWKQQRDLAGAELKRMTGKGFDRVEWRISNDGRRRRLTVEEILNQASGVALINDVGGNDSVAGDLGCLGDAAKAGAGVQQNLAAIKVFDLEQPDRDPGRLHIMI